MLTQHYYTPLLASLHEASPLVSRRTCNQIFANFGDVLQLSGELLHRLDTRLARAWDPAADQLGDVLLPIAPFLKMYALFMQNFSASLQCIETERRLSARFRRFLLDAEARMAALPQHPLPLGLEAQLLAVVQRVPKYRLLLRELLRHTPPAHADYGALHAVYEIVGHTASYINEHIRQHEHALLALELQRALVGLDEPLVVAGRRLLHCGTLLKSCRKDIQPRWCYLFTDLFLVVSAGAATPPTPRRHSALIVAPSSDDAPRTSPRTSRELSPPDSDTSASATSLASRGDAEPGTLWWPTAAAGAAYAPPGTPGGRTPSVLYLHNMLQLNDMTVVAYDDVGAPLGGLPLSASMPNLGAATPDVPSAAGRLRLEILSPQCSFTLYAASRDEQHTWVTALRDAQEEYRASLPSLRQSLEEVRLDATPPTPAPPPRSASTDVTRASRLSWGRTPALPVVERFLAPVWVPDSLARRCMRCGEPFSLWRRKHHCRLCGSVFCTPCCSSYVLVRGTGTTAQGTRARACLTCYYASLAPASAATRRALRPSTASAPLLPVHGAVEKTRRKTPSHAVHSGAARPKLLPRADGRASPAPPQDAARLPTAHSAPALPAAAEPATPDAGAADADARPLPALPHADAPRSPSPARRRTRTRRWSIVSVPAKVPTTTTPRVQVHTQTLDTSAHDRTASPTPLPLPPRPRAPHTPTPLRPRASAAHALDGRSASQAAAWMHAVLGRSASAAHSEVP